MQLLLVAVDVLRHRGAGGIGDPKAQGHILAGVDAGTRQLEGVAVLGGHQSAGKFVGRRLLPSAAGMSSWAWDDSVADAAIGAEGCPDSEGGGEHHHQAEDEPGDLLRCVHGVSPFSCSSGSQPASW